MQINSAGLHCKRAHAFASVGAGTTGEKGSQQRTEENSEEEIWRKSIKQVFFIAAANKRQEEPGVPLSGVELTKEIYIRNNRQRRL